MAEQDFKRKLTAILSADVKGYSQLMRDDEEATVRTITAYREVIGSVVRKHRGKVVDSPGDNILAEFASVVDAVRGAVEIQEELKTRNAELPENRRMEFRIGINLGDVIHEEKRIYGDGVNVAARVESLADAGGICVSRSAYDQVKDKLTLGYEYLGEHSVKNIVEPVRIYKVLMAPEYAGKVIGEKISKPVKWPRTATAALVILSLVTCALVVWNFYIRRPSIEPASIEKMAYPLPDKPSIAVLPFDNMSDDPKQEYFSDGLTEQIIANLSKLPDLFVIARNSTFTYKGKAVKVQKVAEDLGVKYVLEGSVQKTADRIRITAQLIDAVMGHHLWSERYDRDLKDIFAIQDDITMKILTSLQVKLTQGESARVWAKGTDNLDAYLKFLQGHEHFLQMNKESNALARQMAEEAIALDPEYASAYSLLGKTHFMDVYFGSSKSPKDSLKKAIGLNQKAVALDESSADARSRLGFLYAMIGQHDKAIIEAEKAVELSPNFADAYNRLGSVLRYAGRPEEAIPLINKSIRLNPFPTSHYYWNLGLAYLFTGECKEAIARCERAIQVNANDLLAHIALTTAYSMCDQVEKAKAAAKDILKISPKFSLKEWEKKLRPYKNKADRDRYISALRDAGLPETPPLPLPDKPSIAVLPFENMSDNPKQEYFSDGITDDLITDLSKISGLFVIARNSTFTYKGKPVKVQQVARDLGVRYVLEGSVRKAADQVRINAQLIDATTGHHLWAERFDGQLGDIFALQDRFTQKIVAALALKLTGDEQRNLILKYTDNVDAYDAVLQGWEYYNRGKRENLVEAVKHFNKAVELDPNYGRAHSLLARAYQYSMSKNWDKDLGWPNARSLRDKHLQEALKNPTSYAHRAFSYILTYRHKHEEAITEAERALRLTPSDADSHYSMGRALLWGGRSNEAVSYVESAMKLDPHYPPYYLWTLGFARFLMGQMEEALVLGERARKRSQQPRKWLETVAHAQLGRGQEAADILAKYFEIRKWETVPIENTFKFWPLKQKDLDLWVDSLRKAGLPRPWNPVYRREYEKAIADAEQAITLNPNDANAQHAMGESLVFAGRSVEAIDYIKKAMTLDPDHPNYYTFTLGLAHFCLEQYEEAASSLESCLLKRKMHSRPPMWLLAATYAHLGRQQEAEEVLTKYMKERRYEGYTVERVLKMYLHAFKDPKDTERFAEGLHKAGLPMK